MSLTAVVYRTMRDMNVLLQEFAGILLVEPSDEYIAAGLLGF